MIAFSPLLRLSNITSGAYFVPPPIVADLSTTAVGECQYKKIEAWGE
jgi:hypothetical protein